MMNCRMTPHSFIKWAGGKGRMTSHIIQHMPSGTFRYFEPFAGGAAVFFELFRQKRVTRAVLGDNNPDLMNAYRVIKSSVDELIQELQSGYYVYDKTSYLKIRSQAPTEAVVKAARFIYLNRTCYNGLYRVNKDGGFNVPFGTYDNPKICDATNLRAVSLSLRKVKLVEKSFSESVREAKKGDVVYLDPPYFPISATSNFTAYTKSGFGLKEHTELAMVFANLADRGVCTIMSNSAAPTVRRLFRDYNIIELRGARSVGGSSGCRKSVTEVMISANAIDLISKSGFHHESPDGHI